MSVRDEFPLSMMKLLVSKSTNPKVEDGMLNIECRISIDGTSKRSPPSLKYNQQRGEVQMRRYEFNSSAEMIGERSCPSNLVLGLWSKSVANTRRAKTMTLADTNLCDDERDGQFHLHGKAQPGSK